jgi:predicted MFS family arabinose efflux permease
VRSIEDIGGQEKTSNVGRMVLPTLSLTQFIMGTPGVLTGLLLVDIGLTFNRPVGVIGQIQTLASIIALLTALAVGALSVKYNPRNLLILGVGLLLISALGCCSANSFIMLLLFYPINGLGTSLVGPMANTLVAEYFPEEERAGPIGWLIAGGSLSWVVGAQVITYLAGIGGWRLPYAVFIVTSLAIGLFFVRQFLPVSRVEEQVSQVNLADGIKAVMTNRSAVSCLISTILRMASFQVILLYSASYFREKFMLSREITSILITVSALCFTFGSLMSGRLVKQIGRKRVSYIFLLLAGVLFSLLTNIRNQWLIYLIYFLGPLFMGICYSSSLSLFLEQIPSYRGSMMAFTAAFGNLGLALGAALGGALLLLGSYSTLGIVLGSLGVMGSVVVYLFVKDTSAY